MKADVLDPMLLEGPIDEVFNAAISGYWVRDDRLRTRIKEALRKWNPACGPVLFLALVLVVQTT